VELLTNAQGTLSELRRRVAVEVDPVLRRSAEQGFLGSMPVSEQVDHALGFVFTVETVLNRHPTSVVDLGTGGGIPGLVLLSCWPDTQIVLLDASQRRTDFLKEETADWHRDGHLEIVRGRAEEVARDERFRQQFDLVTARSFGSPAVTAECGAPLLAMGGVLAVSEPPGEDADRWPADGLVKVGLTRSSAARFESRFNYQILRKSGPTGDRYPRRVGIPSKRPLF
jgi:16S rRNA (guanine527-N7)-methyltransferase